MAVLSGGAVIIPTSQMKTLRFRESEELPNFLQSSESQEPNPDASNVVRGSASLRVPAASLEETVALDPEDKGPIVIVFDSDLTLSSNASNSESGFKN